MTLIDSNIIIYAAEPHRGSLRTWIAAQSPSVSAVSVVEVLGYHLLTQPAREHFEEFFRAAVVLPISAAVILQAVRLRQLRRMTLGDSLVAASALAYVLTLATHNVRDFEWISGMRIVDPVSPRS